ncbi:MAG: DUF494 domain-containing protein [Bacteroidetes bacterium]|nr:DUF494 domain-containing protein [Bacteroidota bacterium]
MKYYPIVTERSERIVDIVAWAVAQIQHDHFDAEQFYMLERAGFTPKEISIAFSWLSEKINTKIPNEVSVAMASPSQSYRYFSDEEKECFTEEAFNNITKFMSLGLIKPGHLDIIFDRASILGLKKVTNELVRQFVAFFIFEAPHPNENFARFNLSGDESVN